ncbi:uncharacterized protein LOC126150027 [Schistocerca cancellata]|uniref:uncharacterized protein LOC126150027 n=1 Tax=Schistocerca cancellata TaxID=274614 RepID=UPI0021186227|nr:uncharacterized protein LOC126150027 [Schistocerca cancellata]
MGSLVVLLLIVSGALAEVTECTGGSNRAMPAPTEHTAREGKASSDHPRVILLQPITTEESSGEYPRPTPINSVCMMKVKCADASPIYYAEELQRDEEYQDAPSTAQETTAATSSTGSPKPTPPPVPCTVEIQVLQKFRGQCVRLGQHFGGCRAGPFVSPLQPPCHPPPEH